VDILKESTILLSNKTRPRDVAQKIKALILEYADNIASHEVLTSKELRALMKEYDDYYHKHVSKLEKLDWIGSQLAPKDVFIFLSRVFKFKDELTIERRTYATNSTAKKPKPVDVYFVDRQVMQVPFDDIIVDLMDFDGKEDFVQKLVRDHTTENWRPIGNHLFKRRIEKNVHLSGKFLFIHVARLIANDLKLDNPVTAPQVVKYKESKKHLYLRSIIVHQGGSYGGHYTCFLMCGNKWYLYDNLKFRGSCKLIGEYEDVLRYKNGFVAKNCTDFVYAVY
jgi:hypothetical protein